MLPVALWPQHALHASTPRLFSVHFDSLQSSSEAPDTSHFLYGQHPLSRAEVAGTVTDARILTGGERLSITIDDGTGSVQAVIYLLNQDGSPSFHARPDIADIVCVAGKIGWGFRSGSAGSRCRELSAVSSVRLLHDVDELCAVWIETARLHAAEYLKPVSAWMEDTAAGRSRKWDSLRPVSGIPPRASAPVPAALLATSAAPVHTERRELLVSLVEGVVLQMLSENTEEEPLHAGNRADIRTVGGSSSAYLGSTHTLPASVAPGFIAKGQRTSSAHGHSGVDSALRFLPSPFSLHDATSRAWDRLPQALLLGAPRGSQDDARPAVLQAVATALSAQWARGALWLLRDPRLPAPLPDPSAAVDPWAQQRRWVMVSPSNLRAVLVALLRERSTAPAPLVASSSRGAHVRDLCATLNQGLQGYIACVPIQLVRDALSEAATIDACVFCVGRDLYLYDAVAES
jgi:hypothetical protein